LNDKILLVSQSLVHDVIEGYEFMTMLFDELLAPLILLSPNFFYIWKHKLLFLLFLLPLFHHLMHVILDLIGNKVHWHFPLSKLLDGLISFDDFFLKLGFFLLFLEQSCL